MTEAAPEGERAGVRPRHLLLLVASIAGVVMTTWRLGVASIRGDEVFYRAAALRYLEGDWLANAQHPPLAKELIALSLATLGDGAVAARLPSAISAWLTGFLVAGIVWQLTARTKGGVLAGVGGALLWWVLPFEPARMATLEAPLCLFVTAATYAWLRARSSHALGWFAAGGALVGLAVATKLTGALAAVGVVPALWHVLRGHRDLWAEAQLGPRARRRLDQARRSPLRLGLLAITVSIAAALTAWALPYLPLGADAVEAIRTAVTFQVEHARKGHPYPVAGQELRYPPWWSGWWFQADHLGLLATLALWTLAIVGALRHWRRAAPVTATLAVLAAAVAASPLQLPHYQYVWWPLLTVLAASAWATAAPTEARDRTGGRVLSVGMTVLTLCVAGPLVLAAGAHARQVIELDASDYRGAAAVVSETVAPDTPITVWAEPGAMRIVLPDQEMTRLLPRDANPRVLVVEPAWTARKEGLDVTLWESCRSAPYDRRTTGSLVVYVRDDSQPLTPRGSLAPGCEALPLAGR